MSGTLAWLVVLWAVLLVALGAVAVWVRAGGRVAPVGRRPWGALAPLVAVPVVLVVSSTAQSADAIRLAEADISGDHRNTVSHLTEAVLHDVDRRAEPVTISAFLRRDQSQFRTLVRLLERYTARSSELRLRFVDPDAQPVQAREYGVSRPGDVFVEQAGRRTSVDAPTEIAVTTAIVRALNGEHRLCWSSGHGEAAADDPILDQARAALARHGFAVTPIRLADGPDALAPCDAVVVVNPRAAPVPAEAELWARYLDGRGRGLLLLDPEDTAAEVAASWADPLDVTVRPGLVTSNRHTLVGDARAIATDEFPSANPVTQGVPAVLVLGAGGILLPADRPEAGLTTSPLVRADPGDGAPLIAGALDRSTVNGNGPEASIERGRAVVVADGDWLKNDAFELLGNNEFLIRALHWIVQAETLIAIPARQGPATVLALTAADLRRIDRAMFVLPPLAVLTLAGGRSAMARLRRRGA